MSIHETSLLIAEDDSEILGILESIFSKHFNVIYTAIDGKMAQMIVKEKNPDIILTDIEMPEVSGLDFVIKIRSEGKNTPIVMMSGARDREYLIKAIKLGIHDFVDKPFKKADVESAVHRVLEISVRENDLSEMIKKFGEDSSEVKQQKKMIGLLQAISAKKVG